MAVNVKMEVSVKDVVINADGTVTISSPELAAALTEAKGVKDRTSTMARRLVLEHQAILFPRLSRSSQS